MVFPGHRRATTADAAASASDAPPPGSATPPAPPLTALSAAAVASSLSAALAAPPAPPLPPAMAIDAGQIPHVLVLPHPRVPALATMDSEWHMVSLEGKPVRAHPTMPVMSAFGLDHTVDAHVTCYTIRTDAGIATTPIPRLTKQLVAGLDRMRDEERGMIERGALTPERAVFMHIEGVVGTMLALDFDLPQHVRWSDAHREQVQRLVSDAAQRNPLFHTPTLFYTTSGGFRMVWFLAQPVDVHGAGGLEDLLFGLVAHAYIAGLTVDTACKDWTRLFRLPRVIRADKPPAEAQTWLQPYYAQSWGRVDFGAREALPPTGAALVHQVAAFQPLSAMSLAQFATNAQAHRLAEDKWKHRIGRAPTDLRDTFKNLHIGERPDDAAVQQLIAGGHTQSAAYKQAINRLRAMGFARDKDREVPEARYAYSVLVESVDICVVENGQKQLHQGISKLARSLCYCFRDRLGEGQTDITAQFIHALVVQPARKANAERAADGSGKARSEAEIDAEVWRLVSWFYQHFRGSAIVVAEEAASEAQERADLQLKLLAQVGAHQEVIVGSLLRWSGAEGDLALSEWVRVNWPKLLLVRHPEGRSVLTFSPSGQMCYSTPAKEWGDVLSLCRDAGHELIPLSHIGKNGEPRLSKMEDVLRASSSMCEDLFASRLTQSSQLRIVRATDGIRRCFVQSLPGMRTDIEPRYDPLVNEWLHLLGGSEVNKLLDWIAAFPRIDRACAALYLEGYSGIGKGMLGRALANMTLSRYAAKFDDVFGQFQESLIKTPFLWADERITAKRVTKSVMDTFKQVISGEFDTLNPKGDKSLPLEGHWRVLITANHDSAIPWDADMNAHDREALEMRLIHLKPEVESIRRFFERLGQYQGTRDWPETVIPQHFAHLAQTRTLAEDGRFLVCGGASHYLEKMQSMTSGAMEALRILGRLLQEPQKYPDSIVIRDDEVYFNVAAGYEVMSKIAAAEYRQEFPRSERLLSRAIKNASHDEEAKVMRVTSSRGKGSKVMRMWRLNMHYIIGWLDTNHQDADLRHAIGPVIWKRDAPATIQQMYEALEPAKLAKATAPPPPPPPTNDKVVPFPMTGLQSFK